jgi:hypothetical protein
LKVDELSEQAIRRRISRATLTVSQQQKLIAQLKKDGLPILYAEQYMGSLQERLAMLKTTLPEPTTYIGSRFVVGEVADRRSHGRDGDRPSGSRPATPEQPALRDPADGHRVSLVAAED